LYDATDRLYIVHNGITDPDRCPGDLPEEIKNDPKVIYNTIDNRHTFEYPTICLAQRVARESSQPFQAYYFHTKGATTADYVNKNGAWWWRQYLDNYTILRWRDNVDKLNEGFDIVGVEWRTSPGMHFSGNYWWTTSEYLKRLPDGQEWWNNHSQDRIYAEMFIGLANPKYYCFNNTTRDLYRHDCTPEQWT
jgi:hypothetical protein